MIKKETIAVYESKNVQQKFVDLTDVTVFMRRFEVLHWDMNS